MLTLAAGQVECLRDAVLPVECGICRRISRGRIGCWPTRRCCADRAGGRRLGTSVLPPRLVSAWRDVVPLVGAGGRPYAARRRVGSARSLLTSMWVSACWSTLVAPRTLEAVRNALSHHDPNQESGPDRSAALSLSGEASGFARGNRRHNLRRIGGQGTKRWTVSRSRCWACIGEACFG